MFVKAHEPFSGQQHRAIGLGMRGGDKEPAEFPVSIFIELPGSVSLMTKESDARRVC